MGYNTLIQRWDLHGNVAVWKKKKDMSILQKGTVETTFLVAVGSPTLLFRGNELFSKNSFLFLSVFHDQPKPDFFSPCAVCHTIF